VTATFSELPMRQSRIKEALHFLSCLFSSGVSIVHHRSFAKALLHIHVRQNVETRQQQALHGKK